MKQKIQVELDFDNTHFSKKGKLSLSLDIGSGNFNDEKFNIAMSTSGRIYEISFRDGRMATVDISPIIETLVAQALQSEE